MKKEKVEKVEVLEREAFVQLCNDMQGFISTLVEPMFADTAEEDEKMKVYNAVVRKGLSDLKDFLRNLSLVPPIKSK